MKTKYILRIVLSSPGDVEAERSSVKYVIDELNHLIADERNLRLELTCWDTDASPGFHADGPQGLIDPLLNIQDCDILLGIFWQRFGTATKDAQSGTEFEFRTAVESWKKLGQPQIMMYFKEAERKLKTAEAHEQFARVLRFKENFPTQGLYWPFRDLQHFERSVRNHLTQHILRRFLISDAAQASTATEPPEQYLIRSHCRNLEQEFSTIHLFGEARRDADVKGSARDHITDIDRSFVPLHLQLWQNEAEMKLASALDIRDLFFKQDSPERFLLRGLPGSGKTTLLRYLTHRFASRTAAGEKERVPVYMRLKSINLSESTLEEVIKDQIKAYSSKESYHALCAENRFLESKMVLLFDGLDEIEHAETSNEFAIALDKLTRKYPRCNIIVTSRPSELRRSDFQKFRLFDVLPLKPKIIKAYLKNWFTGDSDKVNKLLQTFDDKPRIQALAANPFLLSMICFTYEYGDGTALFERRSELYANCTQHLLQRTYDPISDAKSKIDYENTLEILKNISLRFFLWQQADFPVDQVNVFGRDIVATQDLGETEDMLDCLQRDTGLIQRAKDGFTFVHRSLWEYFTALALLDKSSDFVIRNAANPDWEEAVRLYAGLLKNDKDVAELMNGLWDINRPLAVRVTTEVEMPAKELIQPLIEKGNDNRGRLLLIESIAQSLPLISPNDRTSLVNETLKILFIECEEKDCEVIYSAQLLLEKLDMQPLATDGLIYQLFELWRVAERHKKLLADPKNHFKWIDIAGGSFLMGDNEHEINEEPTHEVTLAGFQMSKHPVTNRMLQHFPFGRKFPNHGDENCPAVENTWYEAYYFALWIGARLPTEAEWEYACRGGSRGMHSQYFFGDDLAELSKHAWFNEKSREHAHAVHETNPNSGEENLNALGLANMHGNVWEWCTSRYGAYTEETAIDPKDPAEGERAIRGGAWYVSARSVRAAYRAHRPPNTRFDRLGFRCIRVQEA